MGTVEDYAERFPLCSEAKVKATFLTVVGATTYILLIVNIQVTCHDLDIFVDTGASVSIIPENIYQMHLSHVKLEVYDAIVGSP